MKEIIQLLFLVVDGFFNFIMKIENTILQMSVLTLKFKPFSSIYVWIERQRDNSI